MFPWPDNDDAENRKKLKVLVVDDEPTLRLGFAYALSSKTTVVETAASVLQALERLAAESFDVMILDLRMPGLDGVGVIEAIRADGNKIPVILCSAALNSAAALRAIRRGVVDFLLKPVRPIDLRQVVEFVTQPDTGALSRALTAARAGRNHEAIEILEAVAAPCQQVRSWLKLLQAIRDGQAGVDDPQLEEELRASLSLLAFNAVP
jgi:CheY-like chemotaxis protein